LEDCGDTCESLGSVHSKIQLALIFTRFAHKKGDSGPENCEK
jgi:hypothetical protein